MVVDEMVEVLFFGCGFCMEVEDDCVCLFVERVGGEDCFVGFEGVVEFWMYEDVVYDVGDEYVCVVFCDEEVGVFVGCVGGIVGRV